MKLFTRILINSLVTFLGVTAIDVIVDVVFGSKELAVWSTHFVETGIYINLIVAIAVSAYYVYTNKENDPMDNRNPTPKDKLNP